MEKNMFFVIPEMPSKTFVMLYKKNFLIALKSLPVTNCSHVSQLRGPYCSGVDVDLLMEPSQDFPGIISPKVGYFVTTHIMYHFCVYCNRIS